MERLEMVVPLNSVTMHGYKTTISYGHSMNLGVLVLA